MVDSEELKKIEKLAPEERAKKLKELLEKYAKTGKDKEAEIEKAKKEAAEAESIAKKAKEAILQAENEEIQAAVEKSISVQRALARELEQRIAPKETADLEDQVLKEAFNRPLELKTEDEVIANLYALTAKSPIDAMYANAMNIYGQIQQGKEISPQLAQQAGLIDYFLDKKKEDSKEGIYTLSEELEAKANITKQITDSILSVYTGGVKKSNDHFW